MKKLLTTVWKFINSKVFGYIMIGVLAIILLGVFNRNSKLKEEAVRTEQNTAALNGTIKEEKLKSGDLQVSIDGYIANEKELKEYNSELADAVKNQKGDVVTLNRIVFNLKQDNADLKQFIEDLPDPEPPQQDNDSTWTVFWAAKYVYDSIDFDEYNGKTQVRLRGPFNLGKVSVAHNNTELTYRNSQIGLTWGQKYEDGKLKVFAQTAHPAFKTQLLEGTYVDYPKKKHWFTGFGIGPQIGVGYDFLHNQPAVTIGIGIQYNIFQW
jgi:cell division protein FtsL